MKWLAAIWLLAACSSPTVPVVPGPLDGLVMVSHMSQPVHYRSGERILTDMLLVRSFDTSDSTYLLTVSTIPRKNILLLNVPKTDPDGFPADFLQMSRGHIVSVHDVGGGEWMVILEREEGFYPNDRENRFVLQEPGIFPYLTIFGHHVVDFGGTDYQRSSWSEIEGLLD